MPRGEENDPRTADMPPDVVLHIQPVRRRTSSLQTVGHAAPQILGLPDSALLALMLQPAEISALRSTSRANDAAFRDDRLLRELAEAYRGLLVARADHARIGARLQRDADAVPDEEGILLGALSGAAACCTLSISCLTLVGAGLIASAEENSPATAWGLGLGLGAPASLGVAWSAVQLTGYFSVRRLLQRLGGELGEHGEAAQALQDAQNRLRAITARLEAVRTGRAA